ncbi:hypothetical protein RirG_012160 [Rhizophagus irregularis DAOM 197198w]|uniref:Uncharacterized protein n=1 Tax=Rhizophagus irregularis (strain DAOM 197198w) TaxID=1432141 RepID=A0A015NH87_RHIIW|nr:hypothetical protein RirG_012160 [Rhizophagus irregularis DAOM 197198w]
MADVPALLDGRQNAPSLRAFLPAAHALPVVCCPTCRQAAGRIPRSSQYYRISGGRGDAAARDDDVHREKRSGPDRA